MRRADGRYTEWHDWHAEEPDEGPDEEVEEHIELAKSCLEKLGDPCKSILELFYYHKMSMEDIQQHAGYKNSATAKNIKYKCLRRLRKLFLEAREQQNT